MLGGANSGAWQRFGRTSVCPAGHSAPGAMAFPRPPGAPRPPPAPAPPPPWAAADPAMTAMAKKAFLAFMSCSEGWLHLYEYAARNAQPAGVPSGADLHVEPVLHPLESVGERRVESSCRLRRQVDDHELLQPTGLREVDEPQPRCHRWQEVSLARD